MNTTELFENGFLQQPENIEFEDNIVERVYRALYAGIEYSIDRLINADVFIQNLCEIYEIEDLNDCRLHFVNNFLIIYPEFYVFIQNMNASAKIDVACSMKVLEVNEQPAVYNCSSVKSVSNSMHNDRWSRDMVLAERQGSVSVLGAISELLLQKQLDDLVSDRGHFYKSARMPPQIRSYGDFVIMCQPNNLWLSVKSGFSRERLLASGYTNDVIGVGFFQDAAEFTNPLRLRNFKKAGFLAIYVPSVPVTEEQINADINTYNEVVSAYGGEVNLPQNINGTPLIRDLSLLYEDLKTLIDMPLRDRHLSNY